MNHRSEKLTFVYRITRHHLTNVKPNSHIKWHHNAVKTKLWSTEGKILENTRLHDHINDLQTGNNSVFSVREIKF